MNPFDNVKVHNLVVESPRSVVFVLLMGRVPTAEDNIIITNSMNDYMRTHGRVDMWYAWSEGPTLYIRVVGTIDPVALDHYRKVYNG